MSESTALRIPRLPCLSLAAGFVALVSQLRSRAFRDLPQPSTLSLHPPKTDPLHALLLGPDTLPADGVPERNWSPLLPAAQPTIVAALACLHTLPSLIYAIVFFSGVLELPYKYHLLRLSMP